MCPSQKREVKTIKKVETKKLNICASGGSKIPQLQEARRHTSHPPTEKWGTSPACHYPTPLQPVCFVLWALMTTAECDIWFYATALIHMQTRDTLQYLVSLLHAFSTQHNTNIPTFSLCLCRTDAERLNGTVDKPSSSLPIVRSRLGGAVFLNQRRVRLVSHSAIFFLCVCVAASGKTKTSTHSPNSKG